LALALQFERFRSYAATAMEIASASVSCPRSQLLSPFRQFKTLRARSVAVNSVASAGVNRVRSHEVQPFLHADRLAAGSGGAAPRKTGQRLKRTAGAQPTRAGVNVATRSHRHDTKSFMEASPPVETSLW
jgi:hypothetical protein